MDGSSDEEGKSTKNNSFAQNIQFPLAQQGYPHPAEPAYTHPAIKVTDQYEPFAFFLLKNILWKIINDRNINNRFPKNNFDNDNFEMT